MNVTLLALIGLGPWEILIVGMVVLLLFGNRLPGVMRSMGQGITQFKRGLNDTDDEPSKEIPSKSNP